MHIGFQGLCCNGSVSFLTEISWRTWRVSRGAGAWRTCLENCEDLYSFRVQGLGVSVNRNLLALLFHCSIKISCYWEVSLTPNFSAYSIEIEFEQHTHKSEMISISVFNTALDLTNSFLSWMKTLSDWYIWIDSHSLLRKMWLNPP